MHGSVSVMLLFVLDVYICCVFCTAFPVWVMYTIAQDTCYATKSVLL